MSYYGGYGGAYGPQTLLTQPTVFTVVKFEGGPLTDILGAGDIDAVAGSASIHGCAIKLKDTQLERVRKFAETANPNGEPAVISFAYRDVGQTKGNNGENVPYAKACGGLGVEGTAKGVSLVPAYVYLDEGTKIARISFVPAATAIVLQGNYKLEGDGASVAYTGHKILQNPLGQVVKNEADYPVIALVTQIATGGEAA